MNPLLDQLNAAIAQLNLAIAANPPAADLAKLNTLYNVLVAERNLALQDIYDRGSADYAAALAALGTVTVTAQAAAADIGKVAAAVTAATTAAQTVDKVLGFLLHL